MSSSVLRSIFVTKCSMKYLRRFLDSFSSYRLLSNNFDVVRAVSSVRRSYETELEQVFLKSHQILRPTIERNPSDFVGAAKSDALLVRSDRASQALSAGTRLREGIQPMFSGEPKFSLYWIGTVKEKPLFAVEINRPLYS
ncbi:unnamed protein product [Vicia faba]|uniref:Uncharacterized protein n=1 Tax=Vicia faba TaxID=3906 RepID=A0AAV0ZMX5_VICFA|nr:unnamed protein product [Vicia faba]